MSAVLYEVNLQVRANIAEAYLAWLHGHVAEILQLPGFLDARIARDTAPAADDAMHLCVHYRLRDAAALDAYFREHAPRLRADGVARFGDGFSATRRILEVISER